MFSHKQCFVKLLIAFLRFKKANYSINRELYGFFKWLEQPRNKTTKTLMISELRLKSPKFRNAFARSSANRAAMALSPKKAMCLSEPSAITQPAQLSQKSLHCRGLPRFVGYLWTGSPMARDQRNGAHFHPVHHTTKRCVRPWSLPKIFFKPEPTHPTKRLKSSSPSITLVLRMPTSLPSGPVVPHLADRISTLYAPR